jgi:hypothetical protein
MFKVCDPLDGKKWVRAIDTGLSSGNDILTPGKEAELKDPFFYEVTGRSLVILISRLLY